MTGAPSEIARSDRERPRGPVRGRGRARRGGLAGPAVLALSLVVAVGPGLTMDPLYRMATRAADAGDFARASRLAQELSRLHPGDARAHFLEGLLEHHAGDRAGAARCMAVLREKFGESPWTERLARALERPPGRPEAAAPRPPGSPPRAFSEVHWRVLVRSEGGALRIGDVRLREGPVPSSSAGAHRIVLEGAREPREGRFEPPGESSILVETPAGPGRVEGRNIPTSSGGAWIGLEDDPAGSAIAIVGSDGRRLDRVTLGPAERCRAVLALAMADVSELPSGPGDPGRSMDGWARKVRALADLDRALAGPARALSRERLRALSELHLCPDLRRFDDTRIARTSPYLREWIRSPPDLDPAPLAAILRAWLSGGDRAAVEAAWRPWRRHLADARPGTDLSGITLARVTRRIEGVLAPRPAPALAARLRALEALLLLRRYKALVR